MLIMRTVSAGKKDELVMLVELVLVGGASYDLEATLSWASNRDWKYQENTEQTKTNHLPLKNKTQDQLICLIS